MPSISNAIPTRIATASTWTSNDRANSYETFFRIERKSSLCSSLKTRRLPDVWRWSLAQAWHRSGDRTPSDACGSVRGHRLCQQRRACPAVRATDHGRLRCGRSRDHMQGGCHRRRAGARHGVHHGHHVRRSRHSRQQRVRALLVRSAQPQNLRLDRMVRLRGAARRLSQRRVQHLRGRAAADATSGRRTHHQHIQQPRRLPIVPYHDYTAAKGALVASPGPWRRRRALGA
mgnify:CR=1 FL=1